MRLDRERTVVLLAIAVLSYFAIEDIFEDLGLGQSLPEIGLDLLVVVTVLSMLIYIYVLAPLKMRRDNRLLAARNRAQGDDLARLSLVAEAQLHGLSVYIKAQFEDWGLTLAEQDVALLLLKGFSMKEIAHMRQVSERTARQQATRIYEKSELTGRAGLAGFFLEDLLLPSDLR